MKEHDANEAEVARQALAKVFGTEKEEAATLDKPMYPEDKIRAIANDKDLSPFDRNREIAEFAFEHMKQCGDFYRTSDGRYFFFHREERKLYEMDQRPFATLFAEEFGLYSIEHYFRFAMDSMLSLLERQSATVEVHSLAHFDPRFHGLVVSNGGLSCWCYWEGKWKRRENGEKNVLFLANSDNDKWEPDFGKPGALRELIEKINFDGNSTEVDDQRQLLEVWLLSIFFKEALRTKMIPAFIGPNGSGKTTAARQIVRLLQGFDADVVGIRPDKLDAFVAAVTHNPFLVLDNVDGSVKWLENSLATYATGETFKLRKLYSTNEEVSYRPRATLMITSREPDFRRPDVAERILPFYMARLPEFQDETSIYEELLQKRDAIMGDVLNQCAVVVEALKSTPTRKFNFRMADFANFGWRLYEYQGRGKEWEAILGRLERRQTEFASLGDVFIEILKLVMEKEESVTFTTGDLYHRCRILAESMNITFPTTAQSFGRTFWERQRGIEVELGVKIFRRNVGSNKVEVTIRKASSS